MEPEKNSNQSCQVCLKGGKNAFRVTPDAADATTTYKLPLLLIQQPADGGHFFSELHIINSMQFWAWQSRATYSQYHS